MNIVPEPIFVSFFFRKFDYYLTNQEVGKKDIKVSDYTQYSFPALKSYSIDEIMAAGGPTAFAEKIGKSAQTFMDHLKKIPKDVLLTEEEYLSALETLNQSK